MNSNPNAPEVDVLIALNAMKDAAAKADSTYNDSLAQWKRYDENESIVRTAVAALLTREAALGAEVDLLRRVQASMATEGVALVAERDALAAEVGALRLDALRWREVSDKAWFVDAASYMYGLRTGSFGPTCDMDEVVSAIDAARAEAGA